VRRAAARHIGPVARQPILLRRESDVGHAARAVSRSVALSADTLAFLALHTGLRCQPARGAQPVGGASR
jgi:prolyl oligopeptidase